MHERHGACRDAQPLPLALPSTPLGRGGLAMKRYLVRVDPIACDGHGLCADLLPERIELDEWGYPIDRPHPGAR